MKVVHLATQDLGGGGFDAAYRLHRSMLNSGHDSHMIVFRKNSDDSTVVSVFDQMSFVDWIKYFIVKLRQRFLSRKSKGTSYFYIEPHAYVTAQKMLEMIPYKPDVIIAHWIAIFASVSTLRDMNRISGSPILWYFMDMAPMTGGCHYMLGCDGYTKQCGNCPQLSVGKDDDLSRLQWERKKSIIQDLNIVPVLASSWQKEKLDRSSIFKDKRSEIIHLGIDVDIFCPRAVSQARSILELPLGKKIIFFGAQYIDEKRKGIQYLLDALKILYEVLDDNKALRDEILIVTAGREQSIETLEIYFDHQHVGFLNGDELLASAYQAADIFVCPSMEDAGPMMVNESVLCGTPVVSFDMGVSRDVVRTNETGYLAKLGSADDMASGLLKMLELDTVDYDLVRKNCREYGLKLFHPNVQVNAFEHLCSKLISNDV